MFVLVVLHLSSDSVVIGIHTIELINESDEGHIVSLHLSVDSHCLTLNAANAAQNEHSAVENAQSSLDLDGEVDVAGRVDDVDVVALPVDVGRRRLDGDTTLSLQLHRVHGSTHLVFALHFVHLFDAARVEEQPFG